MDEEMLENVSGGGVPHNLLTAYWRNFFRQNCNSCTRYHKDCPYQTNPERVFEVYGPSRYTCVERTEL